MRGRSKHVMSGRRGRGKRTMFASDRDGSGAFNRGRFAGNNQRKRGSGGQINWDLRRPFLTRNIQEDGHAVPVGGEINAEIGESVHKPSVAKKLIRKKHKERIKSFEENVEESSDTMEHETDGNRNKYSAHAGFRRWRLIMRNLPFKTTEKDLQNVCRNIGSFVEIVLPKCKDKKYPDSCAGFAFIQFRRRQDAIKAMETLNMSMFNGRKVAVDWAIPKDNYETAVHEEKTEQKAAEGMKQETEEYNAAINTVLEHKHKSSTHTEKTKRRKEKKGGAKPELDGSPRKEITSDEGVEIDQKKVKSKHEETDDNAVLEKRVIFLRNLSYDTTEEHLREALGKYGEIDLAIICRYVGSDHSKGTAFVHFQKPEQANECLLSCEQDPGMFINGRKIFVHLALPRSQAKSMEQGKLENKSKDKRNLHLLRAGIIRPGAAGAAGMSEADAAKRAKLALSAREKLKNLHMFVSPCRLVVHNLPKSISDKAFKSMCFSAASNSDAKITECRIWREKDKLNSKGVAPSCGFGFVAFSEHRDALAALKHLNNNPNIFTKEKRPIVEFSIENLVALRIKESRLRKSLKNNPAVVKGLTETTMKDLEETKKQLSAGGRKPLPSHFGPKIRRKDTTNKKKPPTGTGTKALKKRKRTDESGKTNMKKRKLSQSKQLTKYLALTG